MKAYHDDQKSEKGKERPENESTEEIIVYRETTYKLVNGRFRRELSQNKVISKTL